MWTSNFFDQSETYWVLHRVLRKLLTQNQAKFENYLLNDDFDKVQKVDFFKAQEILEGKSIHDISVTMPNEVAQGLLQDEAQYNSI